MTQSARDGSNRDSGDSSVVAPVAGESHVERLMAENRNLRQQKREMEEVLAKIAESNSWRLTAPLRKLGAIKRTILPLFRHSRIKCLAQPDNNIEDRSGRFFSAGPTPSLRLKSETGTLPTGWVMLNSELICEGSHILFLLYFDSGGGFNGQDRHWLTIEPGPCLQGPFKLPLSTCALRLDPFETEEGFSFAGFEFQEIGSLQLLGYAIRRQIKNGALRPAVFWRRVKGAVALFREGGLAAIKARLFAQGEGSNYQEWVSKYDTLSGSDIEAIKIRIEKLERRPRISVVMPVYNTPERWLRAAIESVKRQVYPCWELCIADDCSSEPHVRQILSEYALNDPRIKVTFRESNGHIAKASNSALELADGEYVAFLDHDDELREHALYMVAEELNSFPDAGLIYSDEDKLTGYGMRFNPHFKSDFNHDLLLQQNFVCHLLVLKRSLAGEIGGFRDGVDGAQDWDLILRAVEHIAPSQIRHIPHVLYHWRVIEGSTAQSTAHKPYVLEAQARAVREHLERSGIAGARVEILNSISHLRVRRPLPGVTPLVTLIIPTRDQLKFLKRCVDGILYKTSYPSLQVIIVDNGSVEEQTLEYLKNVSADERVLILRDEKPFNFSRLNNDAVRHARGELIGFLNNDLEIIDGNWLNEMVSHAVRSEVGGVGARLLYPNGLLQHAGVILGIGGVAGHNHKGRPRHDPGYFNRAILTQNLSAVTAACLLMRREVFEKAGGFEEGVLAVAFNDVDLCLKIRKLGFLIVYTPYAELLHHESISRGYETTYSKFKRFEGEITSMKARWGSALRNDPYYNPNLTLTSEDFALAYPPRARFPWR